MKLFSKHKKNMADFETKVIPATEQKFIKHANRIYHRLLYDTETAEFVINYQLDGFGDEYYSLFKTKNGRWFKCQREMRISNHVYQGKHIREITTRYFDIVPMDEDYAKRIIGDRDIGKYLSLWGDEVEEA